jgi:hypothetical protein
MSVKCNKCNKRIAGVATYQLPRPSAKLEALVAQEVSLDEEEMRTVRNNFKERQKAFIQGVHGVGRSVRVQATMAGGLISTALQGLEADVAEHIIPSIQNECASLGEAAEESYIQSVARDGGLAESRNHGHAIVQQTSQAMLTQCYKPLTTFLLDKVAKVTS